MRKSRPPLPCVGAVPTIATPRPRACLEQAFCGPDVMTPNSQKIHRALVIPAVILALVLAGCASKPPPNVGMDDASRALQAARTAGAPTYAPLELRNAEDRLSQARASFDKNNYEDASRFVQESEADSELASVKSRLGKARERADTRARENTQLQSDAGNGISPATNGEQP